MNMSSLARALPGASTSRDIWKRVPVELTCERCKDVKTFELPLTVDRTYLCWECSTRHQRRNTKRQEEKTP